jgi:hypothetical protein
MLNLKTKKMEIEKIKEEMIKYRDFYGGDLLDVSEVENAKSKKELEQIIERHRSHMEMMLSDANSHLDSFKKKVSLHLL